MYLDITNKRDFVELIKENVFIDSMKDIINHIVIFEY